MMWFRNERQSRESTSTSRENPSPSSKLKDWLYWDAETKQTAFSGAGVKRPVTGSGAAVKKKKV